MNILSIDLDIIMAPDIDFYNSLVSSYNGISALAKSHPILSGCRADLYHYQKIVNYICDIIKDVDISNIRVSYNHEDIKYLLYDECDVRVFNIDHHHDLGYEEDNENVSCANWCGYFIEKNVIDRVVWIKNSNSVSTTLYSDKVTEINLQDANLSLLPKMDKVFICLSPEWVPETYHPLFFILLDLINREKQDILSIH